MNAAVRIDPETGLKVFNTRAAKASEKITGKGYSVLTDQKLKELPEMPAGAIFNAQEQAKYRAFKEARRGAADYMAMEGDFKKYLDDVCLLKTRVGCIDVGASPRKIGIDAMRPIFWIPRKSGAPFSNERWVRT